MYALWENTKTLRKRMNDIYSKPMTPLCSLSEHAFHSNENLYSFIIMQNNKERL